jgi:uncharacterized membrane protein YsdA (DUF1294 family)
MDRRRSAHVSPYRLFALVALLATALFAASAHWGLRWPWLWAYLAAVNVATFLLYAYDKHASTAGKLRVPERVLHAGAFAGGTPAAYVARHSLRHKTSKRPFQTWFWAIAAMQLVLLLGWKYIR